MHPMFPVVPMASQGVNPGNDSRHNKVEPTNRSGGPGLRNRKKVPPAVRGGFSQHGQARTDQARNSPHGKSRGSSGIPASRGGTPVHFRPESRVPGHGGSPQHRGGAGSGANFGQDGKAGVVNQYPNANPGPAGPGNTGGRMHRRIAGNFRQKTKQSSSGGLSGAFGAMPITEDV